ncbi:nucleoside deaminase [Pseudomonas putida]|uniref:Nucleoside deaminase n=1 Tax=Pseudomonas putida TaxID=303 RepID=A0A6I6XRE0_PSEPU|nr:nucleoside deaminase [Pseudomonas putida]
MSVNDITYNAQQAVAIAANQALLASRQATFAVGGCIIENATGKVLAALHNSVLKPFPNSEAQPAFRLHDPTAHGERRLIDWYFENQQRLALPPTHALTLVTTLDPCAMCAGALLTAGFNVAVSALDTFAGINHNACFNFPGLPAALPKVAQATWGYYAIEAPLEREYAGPLTGPIYAGEHIEAATASLTSSLFETSVNTVHDESSSAGLPPSELKDPSNLPLHSKVRQALANLSPWSLRSKSDNPRLAGPELAQPLLETASQADTFNAVALLDPFGNLLSCLGGSEKRSPIRSAFMETTRSYAALRWTLMNHVDPLVRNEAREHLTHPRHCTFVMLVFPDPTDSEAVMTLGAYGSTVERNTAPSFPSSLQYVLLPAGRTGKEVARLAQNLPPFYTHNVQLAPSQVWDKALVRAVSSKLCHAQRADFAPE